MRSNFLKNVRTFIYYTNCLSRNIRYTAKISPYVVNIDCSANIHKLLEVSDNNKIYFVKLPYEDKNKNKHEIEKTEIIPYSYQTEAVAKFKEHFQTNNRGILSLPCGCGKTYTSYVISSDYSHIIILSPLREFASQNLNRFIEYGYDKTNTLLVDSDGNRDIDSIKEIIKNKIKLLISCTYNSMDLIAECLDLFKDALFIIDEFHNLSKANISDDENNIFKLLMSDHKIMFMSATPRIYDIECDDEAFDMEWLFGDVVYQMTFTDAIANKYITDYKIWLPSIHENNEELDKELSIYEINNEINNRCKFLYSCIANNGSRKCIVYCKDTEDMKSMMESMTTLNEFYIMDIDMNSISCEDSEKKRKNTLECFANNNDKIQLLFNIRILNECIDIPSCDSIYISYAPKNKITTIQRISRATRTDKNNPYKIANIYIWCEEYEEILETLSSIKEYDIMFKDKIKVNAVDFYHSKEDQEIELVENDKVLLSNCIVGVKEFRVMSWEDKLEMVEEYIKENGKLPSQSDKNKLIKSLASWISINKRYHYKQTIINKIKLDKWRTFIQKYSYLFKTDEEHWKETLSKLEYYIMTNNKLPPQHSKDKNELKLSSWMRNQKKNYNDKKGILNNDSIRCIWEEFLDKHQSIFNLNEQISKWKYMLKSIDEYIKENNNKLPPYSSYGKWITRQKKNYAEQKEGMKNENIRLLWKAFAEKHSQLLKSNEEKWKDKLFQIEEYIKQHNKLPSQLDKNREVGLLGKWITRQKENYENHIQIMTNNDIRLLWEQIVNKYPLLFMDNIEIWKNILQQIEKYIHQNNILPSRYDSNDDIKKLGNWIDTQKKNYEKEDKIMKDPQIRHKWEDFIHKYPQFFISCKAQWINTFNEVKQYVELYNILPTQCHKEYNIKQLGNWIGNTKQNYKSKTGIMKDTKIKLLWENFIEKYKQLFQNREENCKDTLQLCEDYITTNNKLPSQKNKDTSIKSLANFLCNQKKNYITKKYIMNDPEIRQQWEEFIAKYPHLF
jgi:superfamily II DNA or RNA helicase